MKVKYEFLTGEIVEVEVSNDIGEVSIELDREIHNSDRREIRRHNSVDKLQVQGIQIADGSVDVVSIIEKKERREALFNALGKLLPQQRELIQKVFFEGRPMADIAREEGVYEGAVRNRLRKIYKKLIINLL